MADAAEAEAAPAPPIETAGRRALLLLSRGAGRADGALDEPLERLRSHFRMAGEHHAQDPRRLAAIARREARPGDVVLVGGGDGTLNAVLPALGDAGVILGVLPLGTANDFARSLGLPPDPLAAAAVLTQGFVREVDLGRANDVPYLNVASLGLAVSLARRLNRGAKRTFGALAYPLAAFDAVRATRSFRVTVESESGERLESRCIWLAVGNGRFYGGGTPIADDARIDDGQLDLCSLRPMPLLRLLPLALAVRRGTQRRWEGVDALRGERFRVTTSRPLRVAVDGELRTRTPVTFEVVPKALRVLAPAAPLPGEDAETAA